ncbi:MAG TPA: Tad domain-containing protein [Sphingomicrobium sp.]
MLKAFRKLWNDRRGNALVIAGAALPLVVGAAGLATDTIQWALWKRQIQRAADSAALAGVYDRIANDSSTSNVAAAVADDLGRHNHTNIPLLAGYPEIDYPTGTNWTNPVRVELALQRTLGFSSLFMSSAPVITTRATAATVSTGVYCVVSLVNTSETGIKATGNGDINLGCGMITNSTSLTAAIATGSSKVTATPVAAVGDIQDSPNWGGAELLPFTVKQNDPYADVEPDTSMCAASPPKFEVKKNKPLPPLPAAGATTCFSEMSIDGPITLNPGTYIIDGGNLDFGSSTNLTCDGCTFVLTNSDPADDATIGQITNFNSTIELHLSAPDDSANPYDGILFYQDRRAEPGFQTINGNSLSVLEGAFYFPTQELKINGTAGLQFKCAQFVSWIVDFAGNAGLTNTCSDYGDNEIMGKHVRLVA